MRSIIAVVVVAGAVLGATCATEPRHIDPPPTAAAPDTELDGYVEETPPDPVMRAIHPVWHTWEHEQQLGLKLSQLGQCAAVGGYMYHCPGPVSGQDTWTPDDLLLLARMAERLAVLDPGNARFYYEVAVKWRDWARDVEARRRWPPFKCHEWDGEPVDCDTPDWPNQPQPAVNGGPYLGD